MNLFISFTTVTSVYGITIMIRIMLFNVFFGSLSLCESFHPILHHFYGFHFEVTCVAYDFLALSSFNIENHGDRLRHRSKAFCTKGSLSIHDQLQQVNMVCVLLHILYQVYLYFYDHFYRGLYTGTCHSPLYWG